MNLNDLTGRYRGFALLGAAALLVLGTHRLVLVGVQHRALEARRQLELVRADLSRITAGTADVTAWLQEHGAHPDSGLSRARDLSPAAAVPALIQKLGELADRDAVDITGIRPGPPDAPIAVTTSDGVAHSYARVPVTVVARSTFRGLTALLKDLDQEAGLTRAHSIRLSLDQSPGVLTVEIVVDVFGKVS